MSRTSTTGAPTSTPVSVLPFTVVLTGGIASGKTAVSNIFESLDVPVIDTDRIARQVVEPGQPALSEIAATFGEDVLKPDGHLDRAALREKIFSDPAARRTLEKILHPRIEEIVIERLADVSAPYCILVIPLYAESSAYRWVDCVLVVDVEPSAQLKRVTERDRIDERQAQAIIEAQASREDRLALADIVIRNEASLEDLGLRIKALHARFLQEALEHKESSKRPDF